MKKLSVISTFVLGTALLFPALVVCADDPNATPIEKLISEMADKPEQHHAVAQYYKEKIEETRKDLAVHVKMRKAYQSGSHKNQFATDGMRKHCDRIISNHESTIKEYEKMAAEHELMAARKP